MEPTVLIKLVSKQSYDNNRNDSINTVISCLTPMTLQQLYQLVKLYSYDEGRCKAICIIVTERKLLLNVDQLDIITSIIGQMSYDPGRTSALKYLEPFCSGIRLSQINDILGKYSYDEGKIDVFHLLAKHITEVKNAAILKTLANFSYDPARVTALKYLAPFCTEIHLDQVNDILGKYTYDEGKTCAFNLLVVQQITGVQDAIILQGLSKFSYDAGKLDYLKKFKYSEITNAKDLEKLLNAFSHNKEKVIDIVNGSIRITDTEELCKLFGDQMTDEKIYRKMCKQFNIPDDLIEKHKPKNITITSNVFQSGGTSRVIFSNGTVTTITGNGNVTVDGNGNVTFSNTNNSFY